jgi:hypothetical protein
MTVSRFLAALVLLPLAGVTALLLIPISIGQALNDAAKSYEVDRSSISVEIMRRTLEFLFGDHKCRK